MQSKKPYILGLKLGGQAPDGRLGIGWAMIAAEPVPPARTLVSAGVRVFALKESPQQSSEDWIVDLSGGTAAHRTLGIVVNFHADTSRPGEWIGEMTNGLIPKDRLGDVPKLMREAGDAWAVAMHDGYANA